MHSGIVYALSAIPVAYLADTFRSARIWILSIAALWSSLCVIFQSISRNFWQLLLARIGMGLGQSCIEPLSVSLISDLSGGWRNVFIGASVFYFGVYIGEAISGQIATAFSDNQEGWRVALRAIGITGAVIAVLMRLIIHDQARLPGIVVDDDIYTQRAAVSEHVRWAKSRVGVTLSYVVRMRSFWLLLLASSARLLAGNVFGFYMPSYLANTYQENDQLFSHYGIIAGVVGSFAVLSGGALSSIFWEKTKTTPLWITAVGGIISSVFVLIMVFSRDIAGGDARAGTKILYGSMSAAYITAELWLGALNGLITSLLPPKHKTFGLAIWGTLQILIYSSGPLIVGLCLQGLDPGSAAYTRSTQVILAVIIPLGYCLAGTGFLLARPLLKRDIAQGVDMERPLSRRRRGLLGLFVVLVGSMVVALIIANIYYSTK